MYNPIAPGDAPAWGTLSLLLADNLNVAAFASWMLYGFSPGGVTLFDQEHASGLRDPRCVPTNFAKIVSTLTAGTGKLVPQSKTSTGYNVKSI